jgi:general secretion pathway protein D
MTPHSRSLGRRARLLLVVAVQTLLFAGPELRTARAETVLAQTIPGTTTRPGSTGARKLDARLKGQSLRKGSAITSGAARNAGASGGSVQGGGGTISAGTSAGGTATGATGTGSITDAQSEREFNSCHKFPPNRRIVKLNMKPETELGDLLSWISSITCKQFLLPGTIPGNSKKVTIIAPQLITPEEAYRLFLAALDSVGLTVQESGKFYRIIETPKAKANAPLSASDGESYPGDRYITRLIRVENSDPNELSQVLLRLKSEQGDIIVYPPQGTLIITDLSSAVDRMLKVIDELDQPTQGEKVWMIRMKNTSATEMAQKLAEIVKVEQLGTKRPGLPVAASGGGKSRSAVDMALEMTVSKLIPDERSNQLIVVAGERAYARLISLIKKLDVPVEGGDGRIHVYYCENANCDELGQTLSAVTGVAVTGGGAARSRRGAPAAAAPAAPAAGGASGQLQFLFEGDVRVSFDRPTNALIILSSIKDYQSLRKVIEKLDSPRKQVFVEAMVMEVALDKTRTLGASFHGGVPDVPIFGKQSLILGGLDISKTLAPGGLLAQGGDTLLGLAAGVIGPPIPNAAQTLGLPASVSSDIPSFGVLVRALQQNNDVNVLSTPHLLIMNNEDGEISVGQNLPFQGASVGGTGGLAGLGGLGFATPVQRTDVALKMKLTPHVNEHDMIRLEVDQEIQDILSPNFNGLGPATSKRSAKTTVVARDQQTIVIGGLMSDRNVERVTKIPFLGDIPIIGFFFRNTTKTVQKTNILIALTPYVITDQSDLRRVLEKKLKERREFVERFGTQDVVTPEAEIDYRRKRGMLEEINRAAKELADEDLQIQQLRERTLEESGPMDLPPALRAPGSAPIPGSTSGNGAPAEPSMDGFPSPAAAAAAATTPPATTSARVGANPQATTPPPVGASPAGTAVGAPVVAPTAAPPAGGGSPTAPGGVRAAPATGVGVPPGAALSPVRGSLSSPVPPAPTRIE